MISTRQKKMIDERDGLESHNIREVTDELNEVALRAKWATLKNAKPTPRGAKAEPRLDGPPKMLTQNGLDTLADLVPFHDIESMKPQIELPGGHDRDRRANLLESLHKLNEQHPHIQNSFQFLAHTDTIAELGTNEKWQVQISRRRRRRHERSSKDEDTQDESEADSKPLTDAHGNEILPIVEALKRVATSKEIKRIKKMTRRRRRSGEECFTDEEVESANLSLPPEPEPEVLAERRAADKLIQCAATDLALESDTEGAHGIAPSMSELCDWMGLDSIPSTKDLSRGFVMPIPGFSSSNSTPTSSSDGYVVVRRRKSSDC